MWILILVLGVIAFFLFSRLRRYGVSTPIALVASLGVVILPFVLIPLIGIWLLVRLVSGKSPLSIRGIGLGKAPPSGPVRSSRFCSKCGEDVAESSDTCPSCGNVIGV